MTPLSLTLKGFRGIRDGLGRDELTIDFERLADGAQLIAIAGANGRGKTTVMENLTPYLTMPSRASMAGPGGFSYYEHVFLPESEKELIWAHEGRSYRSQVVIRLNGRRRTEAFLHALDDNGCWKPLSLDDGTVSDGKLDTYERCVESVLGSADTFFTSVFSAQGKRQLTTYKNAEIKTLLADLLGLERIREIGHRGAETAKLLKAGLHAIRQERVTYQTDGERMLAEIGHLGNTRQRIADAEHCKAACQQAVDAAKASLAFALANKSVALQTETRRAQLATERRAIIDDGKAALLRYDDQDNREAERLAQLERRVSQRVVEAAARRETLMNQRMKWESILLDGARIARAALRLPVAESIAHKRERRIQILRQNMAELNNLLAEENVMRERISSLEREAGQAALRAQELTRRFGLTAEVPCAGTDLQGQCKLLGDAREAKALMPSAQEKVARLEEERCRLAAQLQAVQAQSAVLAMRRQALPQEERRLARLQRSISTWTLLAGRRGELKQADEALAAISEQIRALPDAAHGETDDDVQERVLIAQTRQQIMMQRKAESTRCRESLDRIDGALAALPAPFEESRLMQAQYDIDQAQQTAANADIAFMAATRDQQHGEELQRRRASVMQRLAVIDGRIAHIERELGDWALFAKCMGNDGLIALSIDDAGPVLAGLTNDLLLACYGSRFTVSIHTLVETAKGEQREGFDIIVHDAESAESKSVSLMSGGEKTWIDACLVRAVALYLKMIAGRCYASLFSDEMDGALDADHKRMFITMKREVLRLGGYEREYFVSQTPELTAMADVVVDLDAMVLLPELLALD